MRLNRGELRIRPIEGIGEIREGDELGALLAEAGRPTDGDVVVVSQKVVSKAEGRLRRLSEVEPGERARELAARLDKDPRLVELILAESRAVIRAERGALICETSSGWICANAGIDGSNVAEGWVALLPADPDRSARRIRAGLRSSAGAEVAVVIADSFGRPWRLGQVDVAIGCAGLAPLDDWRGRRDAAGRELRATSIAVADQLASAAALGRDKDAGLPAAVVSGLGGAVISDDGPGAATLRRSEADDLFR